MRTLIINGSPKAKNGNSEIFVKQFIKGMRSPCEVSYAAEEKSHEIAEYMEQFDNVIFVMPLYIHSMPGVVMKIIERMEPTSFSGKALGFIVQYGFLESAQSIYLERYLSVLTKNLNYTYLGTVIKGGSAGIHMMPEKMNKNLFKQLNKLGECFEKNGTFDVEVTREFAKPDKLSKNKSKLLQILNRIGLGDSIFWNIMLKNNNALNNKFDKPFA
jgi:multimeric flavodoxin WrbA